VAASGAERRLDQARRVEDPGRISAGKVLEVVRRRGAGEAGPPAAQVI
jgi:hypothetical protein